MVWEGVAFHTRINLHFFSGPVTALVYRDEVLHPLVVPFLRNDPHASVLEQDNARAHTTRV